MPSTATAAARLFEQFIELRQIYAIRGGEEFNAQLLKVVIGFSDAWSRRHAAGAALDPGGLADADPVRCGSSLNMGHISVGAGRGPAARPCARTPAHGLTWSRCSCTHCCNRHPSLTCCVHCHYACRAAPSPRGEIAWTSNRAQCKAEWTCYRATRWSERCSRAPRGSTFQ
jgi:hypothetical protein